MAYLTAKARKFPVSRLKAFASERTAGTELLFNDAKVKVEVPDGRSWNGVDFGLFSAGASMSLQWAPVAVESGTVVVDNSSAFRMDNNVPLVVPEVNPHAIFDNNGSPYKLISNPNCSTIQMVVALKPLHDEFKIRKIIVSTYQSVTGKGKKGLEALESEMRNEPQASFTHFKPIAYNIVPQVDAFLENGYTKEEMKMVNETRKIFEDDSISVSPTTVRVPVYGGHSESIYVEFEKNVDIKKVMLLLHSFPGLIVQDDPSSQIYPVPIDCYGKDEVFVGRVRMDLEHPKAINMWVVADNLRKGAATNAVQILEKIIEKVNS
ncbi:hypothetical protein CHS0354_000533 [Potamilus streckersoni]|uniref:aspartate-semialdehyde dehydrogenase n=1 Tax=Potamilus streckersoni TaxID=2493646 RepID=A0AAE0T7U3_9BIVA|nr:hypothetical protein CHS0354_000533 [Potamilus streckersoni]